jgi:hypothetical protein
MTRTVTAVLRVAVVVIAAAFPAAALAGLRFDFTAQATRYSYSGRMSIEGNRLRIDITSGNHPMFNPNVSIISRNAGTDVIVLEHARKSWFQRQVGHIAGPLPTVHGLGEATASNFRIERTKEAIPDPGGATERHILHAEYDLDMELAGERMEAHVVIDAQFDIDPRLPQRAHPWGLQFAAKTGFEKIDRAIELRIPDRLPLRQVVSASRQIAGGPVVTESLTIVVSNVVEEKIDDMEFHPPSSYPYQEPVFAFAQQ